MEAKISSASAEKDNNETLQMPGWPVTCSHRPNLTSKQFEAYFKAAGLCWTELAVPDAATANYMKLHLPPQQQQQTTKADNNSNNNKLNNIKLFNRH